MREIYKSCIRCPAALLCRVSAMHVSCTCPKCQRHWQYFRLQDDSVGYCIRLPDNVCEDPLLYWERANTCPRCAGFPAQLKVSDLAWLGISDDVRIAFFMDAEEPSESLPSSAS